MTRSMKVKIQELETELGERDAVIEKLKQQNRDLNMAYGKINYQLQAVLEKTVREFSGGDDDD